MLRRIILNISSFLRLVGGPDRNQVRPERIASAQTQEDIKRLLEQVCKDRRAKGPPSYPDPMVPPWDVIPGEPMVSICWRMGGGEDYRLAFEDWFYALSQERCASYMADNPEPEDLGRLLYNRDRASIQITLLL